MDLNWTDHSSNSGHQHSHSFNSLSWNWRFLALCEQISEPGYFPKHTAGISDFLSKEKIQALALQWGKLMGISVNFAKLLCWCSYPIVIAENYIAKWSKLSSHILSFQIASRLNIKETFINFCFPSRGILTAWPVRNNIVRPSQSFPDKFWKS